MLIQKWDFPDSRYQLSAISTNHQTTGIQLNAES